MAELNPDDPANHTGSNIGALYKVMTKKYKDEINNDDKRLKSYRDRIRQGLYSISNPVNSSAIQRNFIN